MKKAKRTIIRKQKLNKKNQQQGIVKEKISDKELAKKLAKKINIKLIPTGYSIKPSKSTITTEFILYDGCGSAVPFQVKKLNETTMMKELNLKKLNEARIMRESNFVRYPIYEI